MAIFSDIFCGPEEDPAKLARFCASELRLATQRFFARSDIREMLRREGEVSPRVRVGLSHGRVAYGSYGGRGTVVGKAVVEAARLCDDKELHERFPGAAVATIGFAQKAELVPEEDYKVVGKREIRGLGERMVVAITG